MKKTALYKTLSNTFFALSLAARHTPVAIVFMIITGIFYGAYNAFSVYMYKLLFNGLEQGYEFLILVFFTAIIAIAFLLSDTLDYIFFTYIRPKAQQQLHEKLHIQLFEVARKMDLSAYDNPEFYNDFVWSMNDAEWRVMELINDCRKIIDGLVGTFAISGILLGIDPVATLLIILYALISSVIRIRTNKNTFEYRQKLKPIERKLEYMNRVFQLPDYAKELRISEIFKNFEIELENNENARLREAVKFGKKQFPCYIISNTAFMLLTDFGLAYRMLHLLTVENTIGLGDFSAAWSAVFSMKRAINNVFDRALKLPEHSLYIEKIRQFLATKPSIVSGSLSPDAFCSLEIRNVSFSYENGGDALCNVNLKIKRGEKVALVGYNGAGKTTLIKLIMRLYDTQAGEILYNGVNIKEYKLDEYRGKIGAVFQDFKIFGATIAENVFCDNVEDENKSEILSALDKVGFSEKAEGFENGIDTVLTREFEPTGTNLSGGEEQKVAIARVFVRPHELVIMDEPSSALDPVAEYGLNQSILKYGSDKTVIFISHRLSTTRMADRIVMFDSGKIIEAGTHAELMAKGGKYAEMFNLQAEKYKM